MMYAWATPDYQLDCMTLKQVIYYFNTGWKTRQTEAKVHWGTYGMLMNGEDPDGQNVSKSGGLPTLEEIEPYYRGPSYEFRDGVVWAGDQKVAYYQK